MVSVNSNENKLEKVTPIEYKSPWRGKLYTYGKIKTDQLSRSVLERLFEIANAQKKIHVIETPSYLITQYELKPSLFISKDDGKIYALSDAGFEKKAVEHQASILLTILNRMGLVIDVHCKNIRLNGGKVNNNIKNAKGI